MSTIDNLAKEKPDFYRILGLPFPSAKDGTIFSSDALRTAYRRTLLLHHPDKDSLRSSNGTEQLSTIPAERFTVDQIVQAYETLSDPVSREAYNQRLHSNLKNTAVKAEKFTLSTSETHDLEELEYVEDKQFWTKSCRCGDSYYVSEAQLEEAAADGEIIVGCHGCSLNVRVTFQAIE